MKAFLIPGNGESLKSRDYQAVLDLYKKLGHDPVFVPLTWRYRNINHWIEEASRKIPEKELKVSLLSGFSFGSMIALGLAAKTEPKRLLLFSLSPYFKEDRPFPEKYLRWHGKKRLEAFKNFSQNELARQIHCPTILFLGSLEKDRYPRTWRRSQGARQKIEGSKLVLVKGARHDVGDPAYLKAIEKVLATGV